MLIEEFRRHLKRDRGLTERTLRAYTTDVRHLYEYFGKRNAHELSRIDDVAARHYFEALERMGYSNSTRIRRLASARIFFRFLIEQEVASSNPFDLVRIERESRRPTFTLSTRDVIRLVEAPDRTTWRGSRDRAILSALYASGLRVSELTALDLTDFDFACGTLCVPTLEEDRAQSLGAFAASAIAEHLAHSSGPVRRKTSALFLNRFGDRINDRSVRKLMDRALQSAGLGHRASPHTLRHSFAQHLVDDGAKIEQVQELLRHRSRATARRYMSEAGDTSEPSGSRVAGTAALPASNPEEPPRDRSTEPESTSRDSLAIR